MLRRRDSQLVPPQRGTTSAVISGSSAVSISRYGADNLGIGGEPAERLLRAGYAVVDTDLKDATTGPAQCHLGIWSDLADQVRRLTGARFIVSLTAVLDFNAHRLASIVCGRGVLPQSPASVSSGSKCKGLRTGYPSTNPNSNRPAAAASKPEILLNSGLNTCLCSL